MVSSELNKIDAWIVFLNFQYRVLFLVAKSTVILAMLLMLSFQPNIARDKD